MFPSPLAKGLGKKLTSMSLLKIKEITKDFGGFRALDKVNIEVQAASVHAVIGPNGAGKTTLFNVVSGLMRPTSGEIFFNDINITRLKPHVITKLGIARTFQNIKIFSEMTCIDNVKLARNCRTGLAFTQTFLSPPLIQPKQEREIEEKALEYLKLVGLVESRDRYAGELNLIEQRKLEIARTLATEPKLVMLDEPTAGMDAADALLVVNLLSQLVDLGITVILVAHDLKLVMGSSHWVTVINFGQKIAEGTPSEIENNPLVVEAYLGKE